MADLKLVGAVAIKLRPDARGFRREADAEIKREIKDLKAKVDLEPEVDGTKAEAEAKKLEKKLEGRTFTWDVKLDHDSVRAAQKKFDSILEPTKEITFTIGDDKSIEEAQNKLNEMKAGALVDIKYHEDVKGYESVLAKIAALRREKIEARIHIGTSDQELDEWEQTMRDNIARLTPEAVVPVEVKETVDITYQEDREGFQKAIDQINAQLAKIDALHLDVELDRDELLAARDMFQEDLDKEPLIFKYVQDEAGYQKVLKQIKAIQDERAEVDIDLNLDDFELILTAEEIQAKLDALGSDVHITEEVDIVYHEDREGFEAAIKAINAELRKLDALTLPVGLNKEDLLAARDLMQEGLDRSPVKFTYNRNVEGLRKVIKEIDDEMAKLSTVDTEVVLKPANLAFEKARMEAELANLTVNIEYENDLASLVAARRKVLELLPEKYRTSVNVQLDEKSLLDTLAKFDALIALHRNKEAEADIEPKVKPKVSTPDYLGTLAALRLLGKDLIVNVFVRLNNAGVLLAAAKLTGLRAAARWSEELGRAIGTLDRNLPIVAAVTLTLTQLSGVLTNLAANAFSLGNDLGSVLRMGGILLPAAMLGLASVMTVVQGVFKDFGAAVNGDQKAIDKLTESGKKAAAQIRVVFQEIREIVSKNFWTEAGDSMLAFTEGALPKVRDGLAALATSLGGIFARILDSVALFAQQNGIDVFFANLNRGFDVAQTGMASFMSGFLTLAAVGSTVFPKLGSAFEAWATRFDAWVQRLAADGTLNRWIDRGVEGMQDLFAAGGSLIKIWSNIGTAAQAAGAMTLQSFAGLMAKLEEVTAGGSFQRNLQNIFRGAREGSENFKESVREIGPAMDFFSITIGNALAKSGQAFGAFAQDVKILLSSSNLDNGLSAFLDGLTKMFQTLRPAMAPVSEIIGTLGEILGQVAVDSGPLFLRLFTQLASVLTTAWSALEPFLPGLIQIGTSIIDILGPALTTVAETLIPRFAAGLQDIGTGLVPIIGYVSDLAVGFLDWASSMPMPLLAGMVTTVLSLGTAFRVLTSLVPFATAAMTAFGVQAAVAGVRAQLMVPVIGILLAALAGLTAGLVTDFATQQADATPYANEWAAAIREDAAAAEELGHVVQSSQIRTAIKNLFDSGAYDAAHDLGISLETLTEAAVKGGPALTEVQKRVEAAKDAYKEGAIAAAKAGEGVTSYADKLGHLNPQLQRHNEAAKTVDSVLKQVTDSRKKANEQVTAEEIALKAAGLAAENQANKMWLLNQALEKSPGLAGTAAAASRTLTDAFASSTSKVDAMRKTLDLLVGKSPQQAINETLGAYARGFNELKETVKPLAAEMQSLGDSIYGENGFLNVSGGNKAVMQVNQALVDEVNNVWAGAKAVYDNAIKQGDNATAAFQKAQQFISERRGDYDVLAQESGLAADRVNGQWEAVFGKEWVLKVSFNGLTEVTAKAQAMTQVLGGTFDGQKFLAYLDLNPDEALKALNGASDEVALNWVTKEFKSKISLLPDNVEEQLRVAVGMTEDEWVNADLSTILKVSKEVPGLAEALTAIHNGVEGVDVEAIIKAAADGTSVEVARNTLDELKAQRTAPVTAEAVTEEAERKFKALNDNVERWGGPHPVPLIDADTSAAEKKFAGANASLSTLNTTTAKPTVDPQTAAGDERMRNTESTLVRLGILKPSPVVDPQTANADAKLRATDQILFGVGSRRPNPVVSATDNASGILQNIINLLNGVTSRSATVTITTRYLQSGNPVQGGGNVYVDPMNSANGNILKFRNNIAYKAFANGGIERHVAQIARPGVTPRVWAERETHGEAYIPYAQSKRPRSLRILRQVARDFGYDLTRADRYANGGITGGPTTTTNTNANVHIGTMITTDPDAAVRKLNQARRDALAVAGIK